MASKRFPLDDDTASRRRRTENLIVNVANRRRRSQLPGDVARLERIVDEKVSSLRQTLARLSTASSLSPLEVEELARVLAAMRAVPPSLTNDDEVIIIINNNNNNDNEEEEEKKGTIPRRRTRKRTMLRRMPINVQPNPKWLLG